jgi:arsenate reductase (thioredoxin)
MPSTERPDVALSAEQQAQIRDATTRLGLEFDGRFPHEIVEAVIADSEARLGGHATVSTWLPVLIERLARERLQALARVDAGPDRSPAVLFLCVHNAGRSQMAAGWLRHLAGDRVDVFSGGSEPAATVNPVAVEAMQEVGVDITSELPKCWTDEIARAADVIVTMGCGDACPVVPGTRYEDWPIDDPAGQPIEKVRLIRDDIRIRVDDLIATLDVPARS